MKTALVTGASGFIGFHLSRRLLTDGYRVIGIDNLSDYYDVSLKHRRQAMLNHDRNFRIVNASVESPGLLHQIFESDQPEFVIHLAAQAGVRYSIENPRTYFESNLAGTFELLEAARAYPPEHTLLASTSSVYGANTEMPYREVHRADHQMSFYAATKKATESMAHSYAHIYSLPITIFRFFTVYGPWGRPDMALFKFTKAILNGEPIDVYNNGNMMRDFTYISDLVEAIRRLLDKVPKHPSNTAPITDDSLSPVAPWRVVNIGNTEPVRLDMFISAIEAATGAKAIRNLLPMQPGDVPKTWANASLLKSLIDFVPNTDIAIGVAAFVEWYREYYSVG